jgi:hypothetical protein
MPSLISFFSDLKFSLCSSFISFIKFIPRYFSFLKLLWLILFSWFLSQTIHCLYVEMLLFFVCWFCIISCAYEV